MEKDWWKSRLSKDRQTLDLRSTSLTNLDGVALPPDLKELDLSHTNLTRLDGVVLPHGLKGLNLSHTALNSLEGVEFPQGLQRLNLIDTKLTSLANAKLPQNLQRLELGGTKITDLKEATLPRSLQALGLGKATLNSLEGITFPQGLRVLWLYGTQLTTLEGIKLPQGLQHLELGGTEITDLKGVPLPQSLQELGLGGSKLNSLDGVELPHELHQLYLHRTPISSLDNVKFPEGLQSLSLWGTKLTRLPMAIRKLKNLKTLDLSELRLEELPDWLSELGLPFTFHRYYDGIRLNNTTVEGVDMSIFDQSQEDILRWFEERKSQGVSPLNEIKVVFLGNGDVGKTHTIARLLRNGEKPDETFTGDSTPGIAISHKTYPIDGQDIQVHFWDFGGQDILYSMHRMFLTDRTIYVVMVDARNETKGSQAREWLDTVKSFAGDAPVLLVVNKTDQNPGVTVDETTLMGEYPNLKQIIYMSALNAGKQEFEKTFTRAMIDLIRSSDVPKMKWPKNWKKVKDALQNLRSPYIRSGDYEKICANCGVEQDGATVLNWCNDLGVCFCRPDFRLRDYVILNPDWITNAIYTILFNRRETVQNGMISQEDIDALLRNDGRQKKVKRVKKDLRYSYQDTTYVLDVVRKFHLSYQVDRDTEFFPMLCSEISSSVAKEYADLEDTLEFHMEFDYLPNNVLHRLMVEHWQELDLENVWRTGARFRQKDTGLSAVVKIHDNTLIIYVRSNNAELHGRNTYLSIMEGSVDRIRNELRLPSTKKWLIYKQGGKQHAFDYEELLLMLADGEETVYASSFDRPFRKVQIMDVLKQAAPAPQREQEQLLEDLVKICADLQAEKHYRGSEEDDRNRWLRSNLIRLPYEVLDQTQRGLGGGGRRAGELDLDIRKYKDIPWTICEALRIHDGSKGDWNDHLDKLLNNYNPNGLPFLILLTYVDDRNNRFDDIWKGFKSHIRGHSPMNFTYLDGSFRHFTTEPWTGNHFIQTARCNYAKGDYQPTVYHIFVRMDA